MRRFFSFVVLLFLAAVFLFENDFAVADAGCAKLKERDCISTKGCFLTCGTLKGMHCDPYICREPANECEKAFQQNDPSREKCEAIHGCAYEAASCFCPGPMECFCGGGPPPRCVAK